MAFDSAGAWVKKNYMAEIYEMYCLSKIVWDCNKALNDTEVYLYFHNKQTEMSIFNAASVENLNTVKKKKNLKIYNNPY